MFRKIINKTINKGYDAQHCELCKKNLSLFKLQRIHKCKRCLRYVCADCGSQKAIVSGYDLKGNKPHRVCNVCHRELDVQDKIIRRGRSDSIVFNYSSKQFIEKLQEGMTAEQCRQNIKNVLIALAVKYPLLGYCQGMNYLAVVLLCFTNEEIAFNLYCHLIENILPDRYFQKNGKGSGLIGFIAECYVMKNLVPLYFEDTDEIAHLQTFLEMQCPNYLLTLLINTLNIACVFHVWDSMFMENSITPLEKCIISIIKINKEQILDYFKNPNVGDAILRNTSYDELKAKMNFSISEELRMDLMNQFYQEFSDKWTKENSNIHYQLKKITKFSLDEIKQIQKEFNSLIDAKYGKEQTEQVSKENEDTSNSDADKNKGDQIRLKSESFKKFNKRGISKQEFVSLMIKFNQQYIIDHKIVIQDEQLSKIFELFIEVEGGVLDLREFLCCMSIVTRGDVKEKLEMFFYIFDTNKKQYLSKNEFFFLIDTLIHSIVVINQNIELKEASCQFLVSLEDEYMNKEKISLSDFLLLLSSPFIQDLAYLQQAELRRNTCLNMANHIQTLYN